MERNRRVAVGESRCETDQTALDRTVAVAQTDMLPREPSVSECANKVSCSNWKTSTPPSGSRLWKESSVGPGTPVQVRTLQHLRSISGEEVRLTDQVNNPFFGYHTSLHVRPTQLSHVTVLDEFTPRPLTRFLCPTEISLVGILDRLTIGCACNGGLCAAISQQREESEERGTEDGHQDCLVKLTRSFFTVP